MGTNYLHRGEFIPGIIQGSLELDPIGEMINITPPAAPAAPAVALNVAGAITGTFSYKVAWTGVSDGEATELGVASAEIAPSSEKVLVTQPTPVPVGATAWRVYRSKTGPGAAWFVLSANIDIDTKTYLDNSVDGDLTVDATDQESNLGRIIYVDDDQALSLGETSIAIGDSDIAEVQAGGAGGVANIRGKAVMVKESVPADGDLAASECAIYFDDTNGAGTLAIKGKTANGTVVAGTVALS
jgi:hypothetical protein